MLLLHYNNDYLCRDRGGGVQEINNLMKMVQRVQQLNISFCLKLVMVSDSDDYNISLNYNKKLKFLFYFTNYEFLGSKKEQFQSAKCSHIKHEKNPWIKMLKKLIKVYDKIYCNTMFRSRKQKHHMTVTCEVCIDCEHSCLHQVTNISHSPYPGQVEEEIHSDH